MDQENDQDLLDEKPPILGSWNQLYLMVLFIHSIILFLFWVFTHSYS
ncbi:MAG: hypothetical protein R2769_00575 [Saprospiraceae bacterium]